MSMFRILILMLLLLVSNQVLAGEKEYLWKICKDYESTLSCEKCRVMGKMSFRVSKSIASVMMSVVNNDGSGGSLTLGKCKIFDEETFECENSISNEGWSYKKRGVLSKGKFVETIENHFSSVNLKDSYAYGCGTEIKNSSSWLNKLGEIITNK